MQDMRPETLKAIELVTETLALAVAESGVSPITPKLGRDLVTAADIAIEDVIRGRIAEQLGQAVVGEERGGDVPDDGSPHWFVDPICGTRNFASGLPLYAINLAFVEDGQVTISVVGDPSRREINFAERGKGAWVIRDGTAHRLQTSDASGIVAPEDGKSTGARRAHAAAFIAAVVAEDRWDFRSLASTLALAYVASGIIAAYVPFLALGLHAAAGTLLVTEAGGTLTTVEGDPWTSNADWLIAAATPALHAELLALARETAPHGT